MVQKRVKQRGFTLIELLIVIVVIAILAAITTVAYKGIQKNAIDKTVQSDVDNFTTAETSYALKHNGIPKAYYSGTGYDSDLGVRVSGKNVIDITANSTDYCIRGYNTKGNKNSSTNSFIFESIPGACTSLAPSTQASINTLGWLQLTLGTQFACGITTLYKAYCWGLNDNGQLGNGTTTNSSLPVPVDTSGVLNGKTILSIYAGGLQTCVIASDRQAYCWGDDSYGQLGDGGSLTDQLSPVAVDTSGVLSGKTMISVGTGSQSSCGVASDYKVYCWGNGQFGQLGTGNATSSSVPVAVSTSGVLSGKSILSESSANSSNCVLASDNYMYCWGAGNYGQLGNNSFVTSNPSPVAVTTSGVLYGKTIYSITLGVDSHNCAVASDNQTYCWGTNTVGQVGNGVTGGNYSTPILVTNTGVMAGKSVIATSTGSNTSCAVTSDGKIYCWGGNSLGQLGNSTKTDSNIPVAVTTSGVLSGKFANTTSTNATNSCTTASDGGAYCWGDNSVGQLGIGTITGAVTAPVLVPVPSS